MKNLLQRLSRGCLALCALTLAACADGAAVTASQAGADGDARSYSLEFSADLDPATGMADVEIRVLQTRQVLRTLDLNAPGSRYSGYEADGELERDGEHQLWAVPAAGGSLQFQTAINSLRGNFYDARITENWVVVRLDDLFPAARIRTRSGASVKATLRLSGPDGWTFETPYGPSSDAVHSVRRDRAFPRPVGWMVGGDIGIRRDTIAGRSVAVAAPVGERFRRQDTLAFLRWTLPTLIEIFPAFPEKLLIVGSGQDMWRGGLSAPNSFYLHPHRPLISGNGTSTLLHELVHVASSGLDAAKDDWLVEGLAEYYSLEILRRTGGISQDRFDAALVKLAQWAERDNAGLVNPSKGANTAYAVLVIHDLAEQLEAAGTSMDALVELLLEQGLKADHLHASLAKLGVEADLPRAASSTGAAAAEIGG